MRRWEPFPEEKGHCVQGGVVGPSGVSAPRRGQDAAAPLQALPCPHPSLNRSAHCGRCSCLLRGPGPQGKTRCSFSPCLGVLTGPGGVCVCVELNSGAAKRPWSKWAGVPALPPRCVLSSRKSQNQSGHPTGLFSLGLLPRGADVAGPPAAFGLTCLGDAGSRARGTWEVHRSRTGDRVGKRAAELK